MNLRRMGAVLRKEVRHILRDTRSLMIALALPVLLLLMFGVALSLDVDRVPTLVYDADLTPASRALVERFRGSRFFDVQGYVPGYPAIERQIDKSEIILALAIPRGYAGRLAGAQATDVQILADGSDSNTASIALGYAEALVRSYALELRAEGQNLKGGGGISKAPPADPQMRVWYNSRLESKNYVVPGLIAVVLMIVASLLTSLTIAREWESGTMEQLLSTPLRPAEMVLGKMLAYFGVGVLDMIISLAIAILVFKVPFRGSPLLLIVSSCIFLFGALFWGIFISAATRSQLLAFQMALFSAFLPAFLLSGFVYAIEGMPIVVQTISRIVPARYFVTIIKGIFLKGVGLEVLWSELAFLTVFAVLVFLLATRKARQKVA
jgi:ABC-2 type transport system permease protein